MTLLSCGLGRKHPSRFERTRHMVIRGQEAAGVIILSEGGHLRFDTPVWNLVLVMSLRLNRPVYYLYEG